MSPRQMAFVGDIHGESRMLANLLAQMPFSRLDRVVFLGDYVNRGPSSSAVLEMLSQLSENPKCVFLQGNHDREFLAALDTGDLRRFLRIGGARTILSYLSYPVASDVYMQLLQAVPGTHIRFLRQLAHEYEDDEVFATHDIRSAPVDGRLRVAGHIPVGTTPRVDERTALIDTGCGMPDGRLSALLWPSLSYLQAFPASDNFREA